MRIRSIKPEFWTSEDVAALDWPTRLLFIGLWSYVDDNGVGRDNPKLIKADLFPLEDDPRETLATVSRGLQALCDGGQIARYTASGKPFLYVNAWEDHQRIDRPNKARYPLPTCEDSIPRECVASVSRDPREDSLPGAVEQGNSGTGEQGTSTSSDESDHSLARFDEFWDTYGNKTGRAKCETAYRAALKKPGVTDDVLISAADEYALWCRETDTYIKNPLTWLHGEHWNDERAARQQPRTRVQEHLTLVQQLAAEEAEAERADLRQIGGPR